MKRVLSGAAIALTLVAGCGGGGDDCRGWAAAPGDVYVHSTTLGDAAFHGTFMCQLQAPGGGSCTGDLYACAPMAASDPLALTLTVCVPSGADGPAQLLAITYSGPLASGAWQLDGSHPHAQGELAVSGTASANPVLDGTVCGPAEGTAGQVLVALNGVSVALQR